MSDTYLHKKPTKFIKINRNLVINGIQQRSNSDLSDPQGITIKFPKIYNVRSIKLVNFQIPVPINSKVIMAAKNNNTLAFKLCLTDRIISSQTFTEDIETTITIPEGNYSPLQLRTVIETLIKVECTKATGIMFGTNNTFDFNCIFVKYNKINNRYYFGSQFPFEIDFSTGELYRLVGFEGRRYVSTAKSKLDLLQMFPHDGNQ